MAGDVQLNAPCLHAQTRRQPSPRPHQLMTMAQELAEPRVGTDFQMWTVEMKRNGGLILAGTIGGKKTDRPKNEFVPLPILLHSFSVSNPDHRSIDCV